MLAVLGNPADFQGSGTSLALALPTCRSTILAGVSDRYHILFAQADRRLQLDLYGLIDLSASDLRIAAISRLDRLSRQVLSLRRLADLAKYHALRPSLYAPDPRGLRLAHVLQALDGWLAGGTQREIAIALFGDRRVDRDWPDPRSHLRDHIRRSIARGRSLMAGGYLRLLR